MCNFFVSFTVVESYEVTKKRTFLTFLIFIFINASILIGMLVLYPKLGTTQIIFNTPSEISTKKGESERESDTDENTNERTKLSAVLDN